MRDKEFAAKEDVLDMLERVQLGLEQIESMVKADSYASSKVDYELKYFVRITSEAFYLLKEMTNSGWTEI